MKPATGRPSQVTIQANPIDGWMNEGSVFGAGQANDGPHGSMISGRGRFHTNKGGNQPYQRLFWSDITMMVDEPQPGVEKGQAQWLIPSSFASRVHQEQFEHGRFYVLWADADWKDTDVPLPMSVVAETVAKAIDGADYEVYASRSATEDRQKCRVLVPLGEPLSGGDWVMTQRALNAILEEAGIPPDAASEGCGQLCYLPNRGQWYRAISRRDGQLFKPVAWAVRIAELQRQDDEAVAATKAARAAAKARREALRATNVGQGEPSLIQVFNDSFTVEDILDQAGYSQSGRIFRHPNSESGSFSASVRDGRVHSLSSNDPLFTGGRGGGAHDAFSAFMVLFHQGEQSAALKDAGDNWIMVGAESWNSVQRRQYAENRQEPYQEGHGGEFAYDLDQLRHIEYGIDGFTGPGLTVIASAAGVGKTSAIVPLAATISHLLPGDPDDPFSLVPVLRRQVVYVSEDVAQIDRLLFGLRKHRSLATAAEFREWFHVIEASRKSPVELAADIRRWRETYRYPAGPELNHYVVEPLIVLDTSNANIDLENENDNAHVGRAIAAIKSALDGKGMVWIISHLAKGVSRTEIREMSVRGASAWMGDVNATAYLIHDEGINKRFLVLGKTRFEPEFKELEITSEVFHYQVTTPWGRRQHSRYVVCDLKGLAHKDRMAVQSAKARSEKFADDIIRLLEDQYATQSQNGSWGGLNRSTIEAEVGGKATAVRAVLDEMVKTGRLEFCVDGTHKTAPRYYWLKGQVREEQPNRKKIRRRDEAAAEYRPTREPLAGGEFADTASSPYRERTKDEGGVSGDTPPPASESLEKGRRWDEAGTKGTKAEDVQRQSPDPMAKNCANDAGRPDVDEVSDDDCWMPIGQAPVTPISGITGDRI